MSFFKLLLKQMLDPISVVSEQKVKKPVVSTINP